MSSGLVITSPTKGSMSFRNTHTKLFTPYPHSHIFTAVGENGEVLPYMANIHSPVRVSYTPAPTPKRKSRVSDQAKAAVFSFRPTRQGAKQTDSFRFKAPDATLPTLQYLSPWVSVTRLDYKDPQSLGNGLRDSKVTLTPSIFRRSQTASEIITCNETTALSPSREESGSATKGTSVSGSRVASRADTQDLREASIKSASTEKRVTIVDPSDCSVDMDSTDIQHKAYTSSPLSSPKTRMKSIKYPESGINYYSGYLPPEFSDKIAAQLDMKSDINADDSASKTEAHSSMFRAGQHYKPLVGDRSLFMRETYPMQPKVHQADIDHFRFAGHERLLQNNGQNTAHFSVLKEKGTLIRPQNKGVRLDEAVRKQNRLAKSAALPSRLPPQQTSIDLFQRQRERTYHLQNLAREMINK